LSKESRKKATVKNAVHKKCAVILSQNRKKTGWDEISSGSGNAGAVPPKVKGLNYVNNSLQGYFFLLTFFSIDAGAKPAVNNCIKRASERGVQEV